MNNFKKIIVLKVKPSFVNVDIYGLTLQEIKSRFTFEIGIGAKEAQAILMAMEKIKPIRPMTQDLLKNIMNEFNIIVSNVKIIKFENEIFYSEIEMVNLEGKKVKVDSRTSDAVAIALKYNAPIFISENVLDKVKKNKKKLPEFNLKTLKIRLKNAIAIENYEEANRLKKEIDKIKQNLRK